jgi:ACS family hexuronate transporter-like MFS transporter
MPKFLRDYHGYDAAFTNYFSSAYYVSTDVGCIAAGLFVRWLTARGWEVHTARMTTFTALAALVAFCMLIAFVPSGPLLIGLMLLLGAALLGLFPNYYALSQDLSQRHQGKVTGTLGFITWLSSARMQREVGAYINRTGSYPDVIILLCLAPLLAAIVVLLLWPSAARQTLPQPTPAA